ncbi:hypothetical protein [Herbaspirillum lusitanum]|uniref:hypothetical protein n=1 Tax=Herbaspirillum lusitanum TaxID=213312 RepID=UPI001930E1ED|nr:hypothetical protein [Herbaspirillum lusitanum]
MTVLAAYHFASTPILQGKMMTDRRHFLAMTGAVVAGCRRRLGSRNRRGKKI